VRQLLRQPRFKPGDPVVAPEAVQREVPAQRRPPVLVEPLDLAEPLVLVRPQRGREEVPERPRLAPEAMGRTPPLRTALMPSDPAQGPVLATTPTRSVVLALMDSTQVRNTARKVPRPTAKASWGTAPVVSPEDRTAL